MKKPLSKSELEIMDLLWRVDKPLTRTEIIDQTPNKTWNEKSIHLILNNMIEKGVIEVKGFERCKKIYGRTYGPTMTRAQFAAEKINEITPQMNIDERASFIINIFTDGDNISPETLDKLEKALRQKKKELEVK